MIAAFPLPAEDDAVTAVVTLFQRRHAPFLPQNRMCGGQRRARNVTAKFSLTFPCNGKEEWAAPRFLVQAKWEFSSTPGHFGILSSFDLISASLRSQAALNSFGVS